MTLAFYNRVKFLTATSGTGTITVGSAVTGFRTPAQAGIPDGTTLRYVIEDPAGSANWETGYGVYTVSGTTLTRNVLQSSDSDALLNLSGGANTVVRLTAIAEDIGGIIKPSTAALLTQDGVVKWDATQKIIKLYDTQRERGITPIGWMPYAFPMNFVGTGWSASNTSLTANGGSITIPFSLAAPMLLESASIRQTSTSNERTWGWDLYAQYLNNGNSGENTLARIACGNADETFTPSAAGIRTIDAASSPGGGDKPIFLPPGLVWLVIQCRHATNSFVINIQANSSTFYWAKTKTTSNPNGATLDFVAATWTPFSGTINCRLNGRVFGETSAYSISP
jgi:hypothetical protein